jgi:beta-glucuronidase
MLRPRDTATRETKRLDGIWSFTADVAQVGRKECWWLDALPDARGMPVPSSFNDVLVDRHLHDHVGDVWYQRQVFVPRGWAGDRVVLRFDAATHRATVWVGVAQVSEHEGGYTPFEVDITDYVSPGEEFRLTVVVNNELTWHSIPPGTVEVMPDGVRRQRQYHDFYNYAGLHRSVWLYSRPETHLHDVTVVTHVESGEGLVRYTASVQDQRTHVVQTTLRNADGGMVASVEGNDGELRVQDPELWQPGRGYLYELQFDVLDDDVIVDRYSVAIGIRSVRIDGTHFLINDQPFYFRGFGKHEDLNVHGRGHDDVAMVHDFSLLGWVGANSFRTSHYPYAEEVLDHADRLGIVVIDETAAVGLNLGIGGGLFLGGPRTTYSDETISATTQQVHQRAIEELIARDKNHPSVVLWSLANEPESHTPAARDYFEPLFAAARRADPSRPVGFVNMMFALPYTCTVTELADVVMINRYTAGTSSPVTSTPPSSASRPSSTPGPSVTANPSS